MAYAIVSTVRPNARATPANPAPLAAAKTLSLNEEESAILCVTVDALGNVVEVPGALPPMCLDAAGLPAGVPMAPRAALLGEVPYASPALRARRTCSLTFSWQASQ